MRGLDQFRTDEGKESISACGVALVDCGGGDPDRCFNRGAAFRALGYRTAILRDDDIEPTEAIEEAFTADGGTVIAWRDGRALEDELFLSLAMKPSVSSSTVRSSCTARILSTDTSNRRRAAPKIWRPFGQN
jgi:hypothetical protein